MENKTREQVNVVAGSELKTELRAIVIRTCRCGSPGYFHNIPNSHNPETYAPEKVTRLGQDPVGPVCLRCGEPTIVEDRGVLYRRRTIFGSIKDAAGVVGRLLTH